ncbi:MAG: tRNA 2-thiocytidine biosynthesis protein TtcA [Erysipelotrichia bacterium]|nr:tRNA 2-thiocytidine biosynthesis protein TtcA [Erysipelotrichia bacterium]NCC55422.1 tRNA 2-thiocytidine biosynthesis protein TtcA [Erysipelotrichia bacterium]
MDVKEIERSIIKTYRGEIWSPFMKALSEYDLIQENDCIAVCISGGKDSMLLAKCFQILSRFSKVAFTVKFLVMDPGYNLENLAKIKENAKHLDIPITIKQTDIFNVVHGMEKNACYLCARMRRGYLYRFAKEMGCNKIALGHHFDDVIETVMLNIFYAGEIRTMMPKLHSDNFAGMQLIRPLYKVKEKNIIRWMENAQLSFLQCACRFSEQIEKEKGQKEKTSKRDEVKQLIKTYRELNPEADDNIFRAMNNVNIDKVIAYKKRGEKVHFLEDYDKEENK